MKEQHKKQHKPPKMKKYLFIDMEATGLNPQSDHIVQLSWYLTDDLGVGLYRRSFIISPDGWVVPEGAVRIHGITTEAAARYGKPLGWVLTRLVASWNECWTVVGHNVWHDFKFINKAVRDVTGKAVTRKHLFDTAQLSTEYCQLKDSFGHLKTPSLQELNYVLFGEEFDRAHDASIDTLVCCRCFWELVDRDSQKIQKQTLLMYVDG